MNHRCWLGVTLGVFLVASPVLAQSGASPQPRSTPQQGSATQGSATQGGTPGSATQPGSPSQGSGTQGSGTQGSSQKGSGAASRGEATVAMRGFCPVCVVAKKAWIKGDPRYSSVVDGKAYYFPDQQIQAKFNANPNQFVPALGGDDVVSYVETGQRVDGSLAYGVLHDGRSFFFASEANKKKFQASPAVFSSADLAVSGECVVCRVDLNQHLPGIPATTVVHDGLQYQFVGLDQQRRFLANPTQYVAAAKAAGPTVGGRAAAGSATQGSATQGSGAARPSSSPQGSESKGSESKGSESKGSGTQPSSGQKPAGSGSGGR